MDNRLTYTMPSRTALAAAIETLVQLLDVIEGDPDIEETDEREPDGDEADAAWIEWHAMRGSQKRGPNIAGEHEDDEDSDPAEEDDGDSAVDDRPCDDIGMDLEADDGL